MDAVETQFRKFANFMDKNTKGVQIGCYSVALIGLTIACRKIRPFTRFKRPNDIPEHFVTERRELTGVVKRIEPSGPLLMIEHKPYLKIPGIKNKYELPVKVAGVNVTGHGISWLQSIVAGNQVTFVPVLKEKKWVQCEVLLPQSITVKNKHVDRTVNVGESLLKIGFGEIVHINRPLSDDKKLLKYYHRLLKAESYAMKKKLGLKYYIKPTKKAMSIIYKNIKNLNNLLIDRSSQFVKKVPKIVSI